MQVRLLTSLGLAALREFHLAEGREGQSLDVTDAHGAELIRRGLAEPAEFRAVPERADITSTEDVADLDAMSKADLLVLAAERHVPDVKPAMFKGDIVAAIRRHLGR